MAVIRVEKNKNYTCMANYHLRDKELSLKAKGLLSVILSLPEDWKYSMAGLVAICKEGETAVKAAFKELEEAGYVTVTKLYPNQTESGRIEYVYTIREQPRQGRSEQGIENLDIVPQGVANQGQLSTEESSTDKPSTKEQNIGQKPKKSGFKPPTRDEVRAYVKERGYHFDPDHFFDFYEAGNWTLSGGRKVTSWKRCCVTWEHNSEKYDGDSQQAQTRIGDFDAYNYS
jgi:hypothetical protein